MPSTELYVTNDPSKLRHLRSTFPKLTFHVRKSAPGNSTTNVRDAKSANHVRFLENHEIYLAANGYQLIKAKRDQPVNPETGVRDECPDTTPFEKLSSYVVVNGVEAVCDYFLTKYGMDPAAKGYEVWTEAKERLAKQVEQLTGWTPKPSENRAQITIAGVPLTKLIRWMGYHLFTKEDVVKALQAQGLEVPNKNTVNTQLYWGRRVRREQQCPKAQGILEMDRETKTELLRHRNVKFTKGMNLR